MGGASVSIKKLKGNVLFFTAISSVVGTATAGSQAFANNDVNPFKNFGYSNLDDSMVEEQRKRLENMGIKNSKFDIDKFDEFAQEEIEKRNKNRGWWKQLTFKFQKDSLDGGTAHEILENFYNSQVIPETIKLNERKAYREGLNKGKGVLDSNRSFSNSSNNFFSSVSSTNNDSGFFSSLKNRAFALTQDSTVRKVAGFSILAVIGTWLYNKIFSKSEPQKVNKHENSRNKYRFNFGRKGSSGNENFDEKEYEEPSEDTIYLKDDNQKSSKYVKDENFKDSIYLDNDHEENEDTKNRNDSYDNGENNEDYQYKGSKKIVDSKKEDDDEDEDDYNEGDYEDEDDGENEKS